MLSSVFAAYQVSDAMRHRAWLRLSLVALVLLGNGCGTKQRSGSDGASAAPGDAAHVIGPIEADRARVQAHLSRVERELRDADVKRLPDEQVTARTSALDALHDYWVAGVFPQNRSGVERNPVFIDEAGRACAVAHLMRVTGHDSMARRIADGQNREYVHTIDDAALDGWLGQYGFTVDDAADIQPTYCPCDTERQRVCGANGATYQNRCTAEKCAGVRVVAEGPCGTGGAGGDELGDAGIEHGGFDAPRDHVVGESHGGESAGCRVSSDHQALDWGWVAMTITGLILYRRGSRSARTPATRIGR
jgi:hypothetical protein